VFFASILDAHRGGLFRISPDCEGWSSKQLYLPDTNVLITRFLMPEGVGEVEDFMPPPRSGEAHRHRMIRRIRGVRGQVRSWCYKTSSTRGTGLLRCDV
jgi:hypothetical protein